MIWAIALIMYIPLLIRKIRTRAYTRKVMETIRSFVDSSEDTKEISNKDMINEVNSNAVQELTALKEKYGFMIKIRRIHFHDERSALGAYIDDLINNIGTVENFNTMNRMLDTDELARQIFKELRFKPFRRERLYKALNRANEGEIIKSEDILKPFFKLPIDFHIIKKSKDNSFYLVKKDNISFEYLMIRLFARKAQFRKISTDILGK